MIDVGGNGREATFTSSNFMKHLNNNFMKTLQQFVLMTTRAIAFGLLIFIGNICFAQDIITFKNGTEAKGKIAEINSTEIKYKKEGNLDGPLYTVLKSEVYMILYPNGAKDIFGEAPAAMEPKIPVAPVVETKKPEPTNQIITEQPVPYTRIKFSGPRFGFTMIGDGTAAERIRELGKTPFVTQFGWQFETRVFTAENGTSGLFEFVPLVGGIEQGMFLPSISTMFGIRGKTGTEFAVGPNLSISGFAMAFAIGTSFHNKNVYFPINLAIVPSVSKMETKYNDVTGLSYEEKVKTGVRIGVLIGFNSPKR
jgi:hypothetical protein